MNKVKVPIGGQAFELMSGRQLVPGEIEELSADEAKENKELLDEAVAEGRLFDASKTASEKGGDK